MYFNAVSLYQWQTAQVSTLCHRANYHMHAAINTCRSNIDRAYVLDVQ